MLISGKFLNLNIAEQFQNSVILSSSRKPEDFLTRKREREEVKEVKEEKPKLTTVSWEENGSDKLEIDVIVPDFVYNFLSKKQHDYIVNILKKTKCEVSFPIVIC